AHSCVSVATRYLRYRPAPLCNPLFFFNAPATTEIYTLSLHDALPICHQEMVGTPFGERINFGGLTLSLTVGLATQDTSGQAVRRSEEHTSELQSRFDLVCRLLLEKKKNEPAYRRGLAKTKPHCGGLGS